LRSGAGSEMPPACIEYVIVDQKLNKDGCVAVNANAVRVYTEIVETQ